MTIYHITHPKAGSQWIYKILHYSAPNKTITQNESMRDFFNNNINTNKIYPTLFITQWELKQAKLPDDDNMIFIVFRDLRDTVISNYFSIKLSHALIHRSLVLARKIIHSLNFDEGLQFVIDRILPVRTIQVTKSWLDYKFIKYEDLIDNDIDILVPLLLPHVECNKNELEKIIINNRFKSLSGGRERGEEDINSHYRKGIVGDWKNYFSDDIKEYFKQCYGDLLIKLGYEKDNNW